MSGLLLNNPFQGQVFLFPALSPHWVSKRLGVTWLGTSQPELARELFRIIKHHLNNKKEEVEKEGHAGCVASKVALCQLAEHQSVCGSSEGLPLHHLVVYFSYLFLHSLNSLSQPVSLAFVAPLSLSCWGWRKDKGSEQLHRHLAAEWGQLTASFKPFIRFLTSI